ncbi:mechanosensitive ion channel family protein [Pseudooceanicola onchidii]|uniref:mechanosensitive ion channel family protein n=1 Tax=Pseudooceanicola onchidii TaxID=2562279 RepID=UPI0010AAC232|nr:mechanosensitive ion channel family protein [Pseudooceanicola onchidii]
MLRILPVLCLTALCLIPATLTSAQTSDQPTGTISVADSAQQDAAIATRIRAILAELEGYEDVTVTVSSGIVTLRGTTIDASAATELNDLATRVEGVVAIRNQVTETTDVARRLNPALERFEKRATDFVAWLPLLAIAFTAFLVVVFIGALITRMRQPWDRIAPNAFIADILRTVVRLAFGIAGIVVALDILGATALLSTILGAAGIIGLAIGFAVKDTVENFIASVMLSIRQPFRPNDAVEINGDEGKVIRLTSRATILLSYDGNHIRIPNSTVFKSRIVNYSINDERRFLFDIGIAPDSDMAAATQIAKETLTALPFVLQAPAPNAWIDGIGDSTVTLRLIGWIDQRHTSLQAARGEAIRLCMAALTEAGVQMPEPTYRLVGAGGEGLGQAPERPAPATPAPVADPEQVQDVQAHAEHELEAIVDEERRTREQEDLLTTDARTE